MKSIIRIHLRWLLLAVLVLTQLVWAGDGGAQTGPPWNPTATQFDVLGFIQAATLDNPLDPLSGGTITVNNQVITVPANTILQMPASALTWQQVFALAPAPYGPTQTGLAMKDTPEPLNTYEAHVVGNRVGDQYIAGLIWLTQHSLQSGQGFINFIDYSTGEFLVGGPIGSTTIGQRVKINDPEGKFGRLWTPDPRFTIDENNPTVRSETGYPMCLPREDPATVNADTTVGDRLCPEANRPSDPSSPSGKLMIFTMPAPTAAIPGGADPRLMAPFEIGDYVTYSGILVADPAPATTSYIAAYAVIGNVGLFTQQGTDPAYVATDVLLLGVGGTTVAGLTEATIRTRFEGFTTDPSRNILLFGVDVDACTGDDTLRPWGTIGVDQGPPTGAVMGRWRFRPPCAAFGTVPAKPDKECVMNALGTFLPATREMVSAIESFPGSGVPAASFVTPNGLSAGQYQSPIAEFLFPENAGTGNPIVANNFEDIPFLLNGSGPLESGGPIVGRLTPWPLGLASPLAPPAVCRFALNVVGAGNGNGAVTPVPLNTTSLFDYLSVITLTATPATGSAFTGWSGACTGTGTCTVTMNQPQTVTATFILPPGAATLISPLGVILTTTTTATPTYSWNAVPAAAQYELWVDDSTGNKINTWFTPAQVGCPAGTGTCSITPTTALALGSGRWLIRTRNAAGLGPWSSPAAITVAPPTLAVTVTLAGTGSGTVTSTPAGISCGATCSAPFTSGTSVTLTAAPAVGSGFVGWSGGCTGTGACTVSMTAARSMTATFILPPGAATLVSPLGVTTTTPTYSWTAVPAAAQYELWVDDSTGNKINTWFTPAQVGCPAGTGTCSITPTTALALGSGRWLIRTRNAAGLGPWSSPAALTIQ